jgi:hypothetical protein
MTWHVIFTRPYSTELFKTLSTSHSVKGQARGVIEIKHSTDVDSPPHTPRVCMSIHPQGMS